MELDLSKSFGNLQHDLDEAKKSLKNVDESIKKIIGRDPSELSTRINKKRLVSVDQKGRNGLKIINRLRNVTHESDAPVNKKRNIDSEFKRLPPTVQEDIHQQQMISKVIVTSKEIPSRQEALDAQKKDEQFRARNKRMFGALLGTLQKFQQEETKLKLREEKRAQLEKKIEDLEIKEKEEIKRERQNLFLNRKQKQIEIKIIELKMAKMKEYTTWVECQKPRENFIITKCDPHIHYLPRRLNNKTKDLLSASKQEVQAIIEKRNEQLAEELKHIEEKMKRNFTNKYGLRNVKPNEKSFPLEHSNIDEHLEAASESILEENNEAKIDVNVNTVCEVSTECYSLKTQYERTNQDKENTDLVNSENQSEATLPESDTQHNSDVDASNNV